MPKVSVIIPVYNVEKYLRQCLDSVVNQTLSDIEIICVNDGSTDGSLAILEEYAEKDKRIKIINKENGGLSSARNEGLKHVTGEYIGFVDSDDYIANETYKEAYNCIQQKKVDLVCWGANIIAENDVDEKNIIRAQNYHIQKLVGYYDWNANLFNKMTVTVWNKLFKTSLIIDNGITFPETLRHEDDEFFGKYLLFCKNVYFIEKAFYCYLQRNDSIMGKLYNKISDRLVMLDIFKDIYDYSKNKNKFNENMSLLNVILNNTIWYAYNDTENKKIALKKIKKFAKNIDNSMLQNHNLELIQKNKIYKISYIGGESFLEKVFSVKNQGSRKCIKLLGLKIKIKSKKLEEKERLKRIEQKIDILSNRLNNLQISCDARGLM